MIKASSFIALSLVCTSSLAAPISINVESTLTYLEGSYTDGLTLGQNINGNFTFDTDEASASAAVTTPSSVPGHEFSSFYDFSGSPYGVSLNVAGTSATFTNSAPLGVVVNDNLWLTADETNGAVTDGHYDWIEILGSTTVSINIGGDEFPADGEEWTLAIISDTGWFSDGSLIPDDLPSSFTAFLVGIEFDAAGNETGIAFAEIDTLNVSSVPVPGAVWLFVSGLLGLVSFRRANVTHRS